MRAVLFCILLLSLTACSQKAWINRLASTQEQRLALETAEELRDGNVGALAQRAEPSLQPEVPRAAAQVKPILARAKGPFTIQSVNVVEQSGGPTTKAFTVEAGSGSSWAVAEIVLRGAPGSLQLAGFHALPASSDPATSNDFHVGQRGFLGYVWLFLMFTCATLCVAAVVLIWRRPWLKRRWLWTVGSLFGFAGFGLNWSNGVWAILFVNVSLLGVTATKAGPFAPWILTFGIPVFAIIVIGRWLRERRREATGH